MYDYEKEMRTAYIKFMVKLMKDMSINRLRETLEAVLKIHDK